MLFMRGAPVDCEESSQSTIFGRLKCRHKLFEWCRKTVNLTTGKDFVNNLRIFDDFGKNLKTSEGFGKNLRASKGFDNKSLELVRALVKT